MSEQGPHRQALRNHEKANIPEEKIRYAPSDPDKRRPFEALDSCILARTCISARNACVRENVTKEPLRFLRFIRKLPETLERA